MLTTVEGIYREGRVELAEKPQGVEEAKVLVTFLPDDTAGTDRESLRQRAFARMEAGLPLGFLGELQGVEEAKVLVTFLPDDTAGTDRESLRQRAFARMEAGLPLGGAPYPRREELYDRHKEKP